jgi:glutamate-1-semialdehyde 2,1-aminomutase
MSGSNQRPLTLSRQQMARARTKLPFGVASTFRYWGENTIYVKEGRGARIWDIDDNEYVDYRLGYGPAILGYADPRVDAAAMEGMKVGGVFALATEKEYEVATRISRMVPAAELIRFSNSGTEAVMAALRLARGFTGRDEYVIVEGSYHGLFDAAMWQTDMESWDGTGEPVLKPYGRGIPSRLQQMIHLTPLNDIERLEATFRAHGERIAAFLVEPIMGNCCALTAQTDFLKAARALCDKYGVVMLIDEVKTGFRVARGGVQELFGVRADICTFAKAMANGYQIAAFGGREDIMRTIEKGVAHGGTYTAHSIAIAAAARCLEILEETDTLERIADYGTRMQKGMSAILTEAGLPHCFTGHPSMGGLFFREKPPTNYRDWKTSNYTFYDTMAPHLHDRGVLCEPDSREPWFISAAHDDSCLATTLSAFRDAVAVTQAELEANLGADRQGDGIIGTRVIEASAS